MRQIKAIFLILLIATLFLSWNIYFMRYGEGYSRGVADGVGHGFNMRDPTYYEVMQFVSTDPTNEHEYSDSYSCISFAIDLKNNASEKGYRCGLVFIYFQGTTGIHAINCFNTTDRGVIFIEPQTDQVASVQAGERYFVLKGLIPPAYDDTVERYIIAW